MKVDEELFLELRSVLIFGIRSKRISQWDKGHFKRMKRISKEGGTPP